MEEVVVLMVAAHEQFLCMPLYQYLNNIFVVPIRWEKWTAEMIRTVESNGSDGFSGDFG